MYFTDEEILNENTEVQKRLELREESRELVEEKLTQYRDFLASAEVEFMQHLIRISGEDSDEKVFLSFCNAIESSL